jgi:thiamine monophosphate kinase
VIWVSEDPQPGAAPDTPAGPDAGLELNPAGGTRLSGIVVGHITDQARRTAQAARAGRVVNAGGEPGVLDLTPLRELFPELAEELRKVRPRERIGRALREAADIIDPPPPIL